MTVETDISVEADGWTALPDAEAVIERSVAAALAEAGWDVARNAELSVLLCDDAAIQALNREWRGKDKPTNVLSFPAPEGGLPPGAPRLLGDIAVAFETTAREAEHDNKALADHLSHLVVHGVLHLLGHDHEAEGEAEAMEDMERRTLARLGLADPYAGTEVTRP